MTSVLRTAAESIGQPNFMDSVVELIRTGENLNIQDCCGLEAVINTAVKVLTYALELFLTAFLILSIVGIPIWMYGFEAYDRQTAAAAILALPEPVPTPDESKSAAVDALHARIAQLEGRVADASTQIDTLTGENNTLTHNLQQANATIAADNVFKAQHTNCENNLNAAQNANTALTGRVNELTGSVNSLTAELGTAKTDFTAARASLEARSAELTRATDSNKKLMDKYTKSKQDLTTSQHLLEVAETSLTTLKNAKRASFDPHDDDTSTMDLFFRHADHKVSASGEPAVEALVNTDAPIPKTPETPVRPLHAPIPETPETPVRPSHPPIPETPETPVDTIAETESPAS